MIFIVGGRGRLGQALAELHINDDVICIERAVYEHWGRADATADIAAWFASHATAGAVIYVCSGLLDPKIPPNGLHAVNFMLPYNIIQSVAGLDVHVVTFGTAMEGMLAANPYVQSKLALANFIDQRQTSACKVTHIRIHTLYGGGEPSPFMFLGLMLAALRQEASFAMTLGRQLREYHHVEDDAIAIRQLVNSSVTGLVTLSHGHPVTLRCLAEAVFEKLNKAHLLHLGALPEPAEDNFEQVFSSPGELQGIKFRETLSAVANYMQLLAEA